MPKEDWEKNSIPALFKEWGAWPWPIQHEKDGLLVTPANAWTPHSILDVGCGLSLKSKFICANVRVGLDAHRPYLEAVESGAPWIPICADVEKLPELFLPNTFDLVLLLDIVEHLNKWRAYKLIERAEEIARVAVVIETPKGYLPQNVDILGFGQDELQTHRCGFEKDELEDLGYKVFVRDHELAPVKRHSTEPVGTNCQLLNAIKEVG